MENLFLCNTFRYFALIYCLLFLFYPRIKDMNRIYPGCFTKNADGTNKFILAGERCLCPTAKPFWKFHEKIEMFGVKTGSQTKSEQQRVTKQAYYEYENKEQFHQWITKSTSDSDVTHSADVSYFTYLFSCYFFLL